MGVLEQAITKGPHESACTPEMIVFIFGDMQHHVQDGFSILLPAADASALFGDKLKLSRIAAVPQDHQRPRLILNLMEQPHEGTPSVNGTTERKIYPESIQFGRAIPHILQEI